MKRFFAWIGAIVVILVLLRDDPQQDDDSAKEPPGVESSLDQPPSRTPTQLIEPRLSEPQASPVAPTKQTLYVTASSLRLRDGPGTNHARIGSFPRGSALSTDGSRSGSWVRVHSEGGATGWMHSDYLDARAPPKTQPNPANVRVAPRNQGPSDAEIRKQIIRSSIAGYSGSCPCPYNVDRAGRRCGGRSAYSRPGGASPICYPADVSDRMVANWRR